MKYTLKIKKDISDSIKANKCNNRGIILCVA